MIVQFSYPLSPDQIVMPGSSLDKPKVKPKSRMVSKPKDAEASDDVSWDYHNNQSFLELFVHTGTHIDTPFHVSADGASIDKFDVSDFVFDNPVFLELPKADKEKITVEDLEPHRDQLEGADILLAYTGFSKYRKRDTDRFRSNQPGFSPESAEYLMGFESLRCVGIDLLGIENIGEGRDSTPPYPTHKEFLLTRDKFFVVEDADLKKLVGKELNRVYLIPLLVSGLEASPVTAFADVEG